MEGLKIKTVTGQEFEVHGTVTHNAALDVYYCNGASWPAEIVENVIEGATMTNIDLNKKVNELRELKILAEELQEEITTAESVIKAELTARGVDELRTTGYRITWKTVTSSRFDSKAFRSTYSELYRQYSKPTTTRRFCIV